MVTFVCFVLSIGTCAASLAWILTVPSDPGLRPEADHARLLWGGLGAFLSLGSGAVGLMFWPPRQQIHHRPPNTTLSMYDSVTGLPAERLFLLLLTQSLARVKESHRMLAVLVIALEQCRPCSTATGLHHVTLVGRVQGARIKGAVQAHHTVARLSEHRFAVLLDGLDTATHALSIAQDIRRAMSLPLVVEGHELLLSCRIGISMAPFDGMDDAALLVGASQALAEGQHDDAPIKFLSNVTGLTSDREPSCKDLRSHVIASRR